MGFFLTWGPFHPDLERAFLSEMKANRAADPLAPLTVLVPNFQLVRHLRRESARACGAIFNVRFETLHDLLERTAGGVLLERGTRGLPDPLKSWVLRSLAPQVLPSDSPLRSLSESPGLFRALASSLTELRQGGFGPALLESLAKRAPEPAWGASVLEAAGWMREYSGWKRRHGFHDREDVLEAALTVPGGPPGPVWVYGFYDANGLQKKALLHLAGRTGDRWFVPFLEREAYAYARPFLEWAGKAAASVSPAPSGPRSRPEALEVMLERLFEGGETAASVAGRFDDSPVKILLAPGGAAGSEEALHLAVQEVERHPGTRLSDAAFLLRHPDSSRRDSLDAFAALGVPVEDRLRAPLLTTPPGKAAVLLFETLREDLARGPLMDLLSCHAVRPAGFGLTEGDWNPAGWDLLTKELRHTRGAGVLVDRLRAEARRGGSTDPEGRPRRALDAERLLKVVHRLADLLARWESCQTWSGAVALLAGALAGFLEPSRELDELVETLEGLAEMEGKGGAFTPGHVAAVARSLWEDMALHPRGVPEGGVRLLDLMGSRGIPFDVVVVPDLAEGAFPPGARPDPLLPDDMREWLGREGSASGASVPLKRASRDEERLLFTLALSGARKALLLVAPLSDPATGDARNPSPYLHEVLEAATGRRVPVLESEGRLVRVVRASHRASRPLGECRTLRETVESAMRQAREGRGTGAARALARRFPFAVEGARLLRERQGRRVFTPYDGVFETPDALARLAGADGLSGGPVSASRIETYATCPLRYYFRYVLGLETVREPEDSLRADPLERGLVLHSVLETVFRQGLTEGWWVSPAGKRDEAAALAFLEGTARTAFDRFEKEGVTGAPALWRADRRRHLSDLRRLLLASLRDSRWVPIDVEKGFGTEGAVPVSFPAGGGEVRLRGRIDRVDRSAPEGSLRVVDYKSGRSDPDDMDQRMRGGRKVQLALYLWAARALYPGQRPVEGVYEFFTEEGGHRSVRHSTPDAASADGTREALSRVLGAVVSGAARGLFPAMAGGCLFCDYKALCGVEQEKRRDRKAGDPRVREILAMEEVP